MGDMMASMGLWMLLWGLSALVIVAAGIVGIVFLVPHLSQPTPPATGSRPQPDDASRQQV